MILGKSLISTVITNVEDNVSSLIKPLAGESKVLYVYLHEISHVRHDLKNSK